MVKLSDLPPADLPVTAYIPEDYVPDADARVALYYRLTRLDRVEQVAGVRQELEDRFGKLPQPAENILYVIEIRLLARDAGRARELSGAALER